MLDLTVVMYHYVREIKRSRFPKIKGLETEEFKGQLQFLQRNYNVVSLRECVEAFYSDAKLPKNPVLLTFDDGYLDHYTTVFPILSSRKISGAFFPPGRAISERKILDVNKIHFILASEASPSELVNSVFRLLDGIRDEICLPANEALYSELTTKRYDGPRYDEPDVVFIKWLLQTYLPGEYRAMLVDTLFAKYVSNDEIEFANELYMSIDQIKHMQQYGMEFGSHGWNHLRFGSLEERKQVEEIDLSLKFLTEINVPTKKWVMCYPYGSYNDITVRELASRDCAMAFTTLQKKALVDRKESLSVPRFDTNDFQKFV